MKSAKETLAQYRLQGFSDELIELLAMEEEDQVFAEDLLEALIAEQNLNNIDGTSQICSDSSNNANQNDTIESEKLIKSAYARIGISDIKSKISEETNYESTESVYIPPKLEVIEGGADDIDQTIIPFVPEYALSEEEHEYALARSLMFFGEIEHKDEITQHYTDEEEEFTNKELYIDEVEVAELTDYDILEEYDEVDVIDIIDSKFSENNIEEFDCFDFDEIGRSTEKECKIIDFSQAIFDLENSRPAEKEWTSTVNKPVIELKEIKNWAENVESNIIQTKKEKTKLEEELSNRDDTIIVQGREMDQLNTINAGYLEQLSSESKMLAATQSKLTDLKEESERTEKMLLTFGNEIELLHSQLSITNSICKTQSSEIIRKNATIKQLGNAYSELIKKNETELSVAEEAECLHNKELKRTDYTIQMLNNEISSLRSQIKSLNSCRSSQSSEYLSQAELIDSLNIELSKVLSERDSAIVITKNLEQLSAKQARRIKRLEQVRTKIKRLEFENNVYRTETIPNLQADKEDLVELASEEYNKAKALDEIAAKNSRRLSYSTTLAAAACLMLVLMPILSWNNIETEKTNIKSKYSMQVASVQAENLKLEEDLASTQERLRLINNEYHTAQQNWSVQLSNLKMNIDKSIKGAQVIQTASGNTLDESDFNVVAYEDELMVNPVHAEAGFETEAQYNNVSGLEEYKQEFSQVKPSLSNIEVIEGKQSHVRRGEGLSQVLWRVYRRSNPEMVSYISNLNNLKQDKRGNPILKVNQKLLLPKDVSTAMATSNKKRMSM